MALATQDSSACSQGGWPPRAWRCRRCSSSIASRSRSSASRIRLSTAPSELSCAEVGDGGPSGAEEGLDMAAEEMMRNESRGGVPHLPTEGKEKGAENEGNYFNSIT